MKKAWLVLELGFAFAALALMSFFCAYAWPDKDFGLSGWIQAFGSIFALAVAIGLANYQRLQDAAKAEAAAKKYQYDMTVLCYLFCDEFCKVLLREKGRLKLDESGRRLAVDERALEEFRVQFRDLPVHQFNLELMRHILAFRSTVNDVQRRYSQDISMETREEMSPEMILSDERNRMHEYWQRAHAVKYSIEMNIQCGGWLDPDGVVAATPKAFRPQTN